MFQSKWHLVLILYLREHSNCFKLPIQLNVISLGQGIAIIKQ
jgi:hypothetical protein